MKVICIKKEDQTFGVENELTVGKIYDAEIIYTKSGNYYRIKNDLEYNGIYETSCFEEISEIRDRKIDIILK